MCDFMAPLYSSNFWLIPYGFALNLNDLFDFKTLIREERHTTFTHVKDCTFLTRFRVVANNTRHAHPQSSLLTSPLLFYYNHFSVSDFIAPLLTKGLAYKNHFCFLHPKILYPYHFGNTNTAALADLLKDEKGIEVRIRELK